MSLCLQVGPTNGKAKAFYDLQIDSVTDLPKEPVPHSSFRVKGLRVRTTYAPIAPQ